MDTLYIKTFDVWNSWTLKKFSFKILFRVKIKEKRCSRLLTGWISFQWRRNGRRSPHACWSPKLHHSQGSGHRCSFSRTQWPAKRKKNKRQVKGYEILNKAFWKVLFSVGSINSPWDQFYKRWTLIQSSQVKRRSNTMATERGKSETTGFELERHYRVFSALVFIWKVGGKPLLEF